MIVARRQESGHRNHVVAIHRMINMDNVSSPLCIFQNDKNIKLTVNSDAPDCETLSVVDEMKSEQSSTA